MLRAGVSVLDITPPIGLELGGLGLRQQPSVGILDALFAKALVVEDDDVRVAIVSCDLLGFSNQYDDGLRKAIVGSGLVEAENVMIACTHTHAGPATQFLRGCGHSAHRAASVLPSPSGERMKRCRASPSTTAFPSAVMKLALTCSSATPASPISPPAHPCGCTLK